MFARRLALSSALPLLAAGGAAIWFAACSSGTPTRSGFDNLPDTSVDPGDDAGFDTGGMLTDALLVVPTGSGRIDPASTVVFIDTSTTPPTVGTQAFKLYDSATAGQGNDVTANLCAVPPVMPLAQAPRSSLDVVTSGERFEAATPHVVWHGALKAPVLLQHCLHVCDRRET